MNQIRRIPLFILAIFLILGVIFADIWGINAAFFGLPFFILFLISRFFDKKILSPLYERAIFFCICLSILGVGGFLSWIAHHNTKETAEKIKGKRLSLAAVVASEVKMKKFGRSLRIETFAYNADSQWIPINTKMQMYIDSSCVTKVEQHDTIFFTAWANEVKSKNEGFTNYLRRNNIYLSAKAKEIQVGGKRKSLAYYAEQVQFAMSRQIFSIMPDSSTAAIAAAMFLGEDNSLDADTLSDFSKAGVSHILAISGQHITIIFLLLSKLFFPLQYLPKGKKMQNLILLILLVLYAMLCGAGASVVRSVAMYVLVLIAKLLRKRYEILNLLGFAAILQIVMNPIVVFNLGFQLSYSAVVGIVWLYPKFESFFEAHNNIQREIYAWIGVTLCAQLLTTPFLIFTFRTFPTYFLLSNVLLALLAYVVVFVGFMMVLLSYIPIINVILGYATHYLLKAMQLIAAWIANLPNALIQSFSDAGIIILFAEIVLALSILYAIKIYQKGKAEILRVPALEKFGLG